MAFMEPQVSFDTWYEVDTAHGITFIPKDIVGDLEYDDDAGDFTSEAYETIFTFTDCPFIDSIYQIEERDGWGARLSAPGYMDCTEWSVFDTAEEAEQYLKDTYEDDDEFEEEEN